VNGGGGGVVAPSQFTSVDVTALTSPPPAAAAGGAVDRRGARELSRTAAADRLDVPGQSICLDELAPVLEDPADD